jgi:GNAT superfamily N-acetyltransferase
MVALRSDEFHTTLRDGTPVLIRPVRPDDKALLADGFARLSDESRVRRFLAPVAQLSDAMLAYLTEVDGVDHFAWVAVHGDHPDLGLGVARYVRLKDEPSVAEAAITVVDEYQGRGLGTVLLGLLAARARGNGITSFRAYVLKDNAPMLDLLEEVGASARHDSPGVLAMDVPLDPEQVPDSTAGRVLRATAARLLPAKARIEL